MVTVLVSRQELSSRRNTVASALAKAQAYLSRGFTAQTSDEEDWDDRIVCRRPMKGADVPVYKQADYVASYLKQVKEGPPPRVAKQFLQPGQQLTDPEATD